MGSDDALAPLIVVLLLGGSATFSAAEIGFLALSRHRARRVSQGRLGRLVESLTARPANTLGAVLVAITALNYSAEALATTWMLVDLHLPLWVAMGVMMIVVVVFAEAIPISYAVANQDRVGRAMVIPLWVASWALLVPSRVIGFLAELIVRILGAARPDREPVTEGEIKAILELQAEGGRLEAEERAMIHHIFAFGDKIAREVMVPRTDIIAVPADATVAEVARVADEHHISRLPVYRGSLDQVIGVVYVKDLLPVLVAGRGDTPVTAVMRAALRVPETRKLSDLLTDFRKHRRTIAIVVDEYGGTAGLVTVEDLLEEVVGDIYDEHDVVRPAVERLPDGSLRLDARLSVKEASELLGVELPEGDYDSLAGLLYTHLGVVPRAGQTAEVAGVRLVADEVHGYRIMRVRATRLEEGEAHASPAPGGLPG